jgi:hypothetical protein
MVKSTPAGRRNPAMYIAEDPRKINFDNISVAIVINPEKFMGGLFGRRSRTRQASRLLKLWHDEYGKAYNVFVPGEQPNPHVWDRELPEPDDKGTLDPQALKHWRYFEKTRKFLRKRYDEYGILSGPVLTFDCLVPKFQKPLGIPADKRKQYKLPRQGDPAEWYDKALRMKITSEGEVGFVCNSEDCQRRKCKLNLKNPKKISPCDIFSLIQIFHGYRSVVTPISIVAEEFGKLGKFESHGLEQKSKIVRYAVPKDKLFDILDRYRNMRHQHIGQLVTEAENLIRDAEKVELKNTRSFSDEFAYLWPQILDDQIIKHINSAAIRLYLWLLVKQEEAARRNKWGLELTETAVAEALGISIRTAGTYRESLQKLGLLVIRGGRWTARYKGNFQLQPR